jgi:hypothetical protein
MEIQAVYFVLYMQPGKVAAALKRRKFKNSPGEKMTTHAHRHSTGQLIIILYAGVISINQASEAQRIEHSTTLTVHTLHWRSIEVSFLLPCFFTVERAQVAQVACTESRRDEHG